MKLPKKSFPPRLKPVQGWALVVVETGELMHYTTAAGVTFPAVFLTRTHARKIRNGDELVRVVPVRITSKQHRPR